MEPSPQQEIDKLRKENEKLKCINRLRRQKQKELEDQLDFAYRQLNGLVKFISKVIRK